MHLSQKWNAPSAPGAGPAAIGDLAGDTRLLAPDEIYYLPLAYMKAVTDLGIEIHEMRSALTDESDGPFINDNS